MSSTPSDAKRSITRAGKKHGVSEMRNSIGTPQSRASPASISWYLLSLNRSLKSRRKEGTIALQRWRGRLSDEESARVHDLALVGPDAELEPGNVDMGGGVPVRAGVRAVGIAERDVHARKFLVLQDVPDDIVQLDVGADGELADAVAFGVGVRIRPEVVPQRLVRRMGPGQPAVADRDRERRRGE